MKQSHRALSVILILAAVILSACRAGAAGQSTGARVEADLIVTGVIESIDGTQWVVNGQTFTVDPTVLRDGPYIVGDTVKVEGNVQPDGSVVVTRVETPTADDLATATASPTATLDDNSNANFNGTNTNDDNSNNANINDDNTNADNSNGNANTNDNNSNGNDSGSGNSNDDSGGHGGNDNGGGGNSNDDNSNGG